MGRSKSLSQLPLLLMLLATPCFGEDVSTLCHFEHGPRAGETKDYAPQAPLPIGTGCQDRKGSIGRIISRLNSTKPTSTLCRFDRGPRAGEIQDYAPMAPLPIDSGCQDGAGSTGRVVPRGTPATKASQARGVTASSTLCQFDRGPRTGQIQDYAPMAPLPIGSGCQDGAGSTGWVVARPSKAAQPNKK